MCQIPGSGVGGDFEVESCSGARGCCATLLLAFSFQVNRHLGKQDALAA